MPSFNVSVVTQVKKILEQEAGYLRLRTSEGDIGILPNHAPFVAELSMGKMEIESPNKDKRDIYFLSGGFLEISNNQATIIADEIFPIEEIDIESEQTLVENLKKELMEVIFSENLNIFKKSIFIQGVFTYANLILSNNESLSKEEKTKIMEEIVEISNLLADETLEDVKKYAN